MHLRLLAAASLAAGALVAAGCGGGSSSTVATVVPNHVTTTSAGSCKDVPAPEPKKVHLKAPPQTVKRGEKLSATIATSCGDFTIALDTQDQPKTVNSFVYMAKQGLYDNTDFMRVVPDYLIQGGDPALNGTGGPGYTVVEPPPPNTSYRTGTVAMGKTAIEPHGASGSQFFVVTAPADAGLPPYFAVLGKLSSGMSTIDRITALADPSLGATGGEPLQPVVIDSVKIH
jgi:cyclophilin family peptidyl-prolyl cis-trans isomerase